MELGRQMNIEVDKAWKSYDDCRLFKKNYENKYMCYRDDNRDLVYATMQYFINTYPQMFQPIIRYLATQILSSMQESTLHRVSLGLPPPNPIITYTVDAILTLRAVFARYFSFPKPKWKYRLTGFYPIAEDIEKSASCPFRKYYTARPLDFGNTTYTTQQPDGKTYSIEMLGPKGIKHGLLCEKPRYSFKEE